MFFYIKSKSLWLRTHPSLTFVSNSSLALAKKLVIPLCIFSHIPQLGFGLLDYWISFGFFLIYFPSTAVQNRNQRSCLSDNPHSLATFKTTANLPGIYLCFPWNNLLEHTGLNKWVWLALSALKVSRDLNKEKRVRARYRVKGKKIIDSGEREG